MRQRDSHKHTETQQGTEPNRKLVRGRDTRVSGKTAREKKRNTCLSEKTQRGTEPNRETWTEKQKDTQKQTWGRAKERECWWSGFKHDPRFALP